MTAYYRVHIDVRKQDRRQIGQMLRKGQEAARVLRRAAILRQLEEGQKAVPVAANAGVDRKTVRAITRRYEAESSPGAALW